MIPRTFLSTYASNGQQQMAVVFLTDITGLKRWADYIPVKLAQGGSENSYANNGYVDVVSVVKTSTMRPFAEYVPVYVDNSASDAWQVNATGYIPYGFAGFGDASMVLDFTNGAALDSRITFTRASTATRTNASGIIESVATNTARFDYNPTTLAPLGLLIEESRTNLILQSEDCSASPWTTASPYSVTTNTAISPDGTQDADSVILASGQTSFSANITRQTVTKAASAIQYTRSGYFKRLGSTTSVRLYDFGSTTANGASVTVSLVDGSILSGPTIAGAFTGLSASVTSVGNGWYRVALTYTTDTATSLTVRSFPYVGTTQLTGDGSSGLLVWGAQLEAGAFATSYIPTVASQVTRAADSAVMTGTNFSSWYNQSQGTLFVNYYERALSSSHQSLYVSSGVANERITFNVNASNVLDAQIVSGGTDTFAGNTPTLSANNYKIALAYESNNAGVSANGSSVTSDTTVTLPVSVSQMNIGATVSLTQFLNSTIKNIAYFNRRLSNAELQGITA